MFIATRNTMNRPKTFIPFNKLGSTNNVEAVPLKLAYTPNEPPQSFYNKSDENVLAETSTSFNVWLVAVCVITVFVVVFLISYFIVTQVRTSDNGGGGINRYQYNDEDYEEY